MANIFGVLTAIILCVAAYVAFKNKDKYEAEIQITVVEKQKLAVSQGLLADAQATLKALPIERAGVDAKADEFAKAEAEQKETNADLQQQMNTKTADVERNKNQIQEFRTQANKVGDIEQLAGKMRELGSELEELSQSITRNEASLANLTSQDTTLGQEVAKGKSELEALSRGESLPHLRTRIRSIYPTWGFVTLAAGGSAGVATNSTLDVVRGDQVIAKLLVTAVESNSASANIIPDSLAEDVTLMVGDLVVPGEKMPARSAN
jgi:chorismate mutase